MKDKIEKCTVKEILDFCQNTQCNKCVLARYAGPINNSCFVKTLSFYKDFEIEIPDRRADNDDRSKIREMWRNKNKDNKEVWLIVKNLGELYMDEEFIVGNEPILFTVIDENNKRYLVMSYDSESNVYHMVEISNNDLIDMLENRITMKQAFKKQKEIIRTLHDNSDNCVKCTKYDSTTFPSGFLPKEGEYYNLKYDYIKRYIDKLKQE